MRTPPMEFPVTPIKINKGQLEQHAAIDPYNAAVAYAQAHPHYRGQIEVLTSSRNYIYMVLSDGRVVSYQG